MGEPPPGTRRAPETVAAETADVGVPLRGPEFTAKLLEHFHRAKRLALADQTAQVTDAA